MAAILLYNNITQYIHDYTKFQESSDPENATCLAATDLHANYRPTKATKRATRSTFLVKLQSSAKWTS